MFAKRCFHKALGVRGTFACGYVTLMWADRSYCARGGLGGFPLYRQPDLRRLGAILEKISKFAALAICRNSKTCGLGNRYPSNTRTGLGRVLGLDYCDKCCSLRAATQYGFLNCALEKMCIYERTRRSAYVIVAAIVQFIIMRSSFLAPYVTIDDQ